jgi:hypothetical protein
MAAQNITIVPIVTTGGLGPYTYTIVNDGLTTLPLQPRDSSGASVTFLAATLSEPDRISVDATTVAPGTYSLHVHSTDSASKTASKVLSIKILDSTKFAILSESTTLVPTAFPFVGTLDLEYSGAKGSVVWSLIDSVTSIAGATIVTSGATNTLNFTVNQYGTFTVGLQAKDDYKTITKTLNISILPQSTFKLVNGQIEVDFRDTGFTQGVHSFTLSATDFASTVVNRTFEFLLQPAISPVKIPLCTTKYWFTSDANSFYLPIVGAASGLSIQDSGGVFANGVSYNIEGLSSRIKFNGPPLLAQNSELTIPINLQLGNAVVASVGKTFTVPAFSGSSDQTEFHETNSARPAIVGENFSLNPQKPYFNSPSIERSRIWKARVKSGSALPTGLSLDEQTGLIYGKVLDASVNSSQLEFLDENALVKGTITVNFPILVNNFSLVESLSTANLSVPYTGLINTTTTNDLMAIQVVSGTLPAGLSLSVTRNLNTGTLTFDGSLKTITRTTGSWLTDAVAIGSVLVLSTFANTLNNKAVTVTAVTDATITVKETIASAATVVGIVTASTQGVVTGTPTEAGHFDVWIKITDITGAVGHLYKRFEVVYVTPLAIITPALPTLTSLAYSTTLAAVGGSGLYTWSLASGSPDLPAGITLSSSGVLSGTYAGSSYSQNLVIKVTDTSGSTATATLALTFDSTLTIVTAAIPQMIKGENYSYTLKAIGGSGTYTSWTVTTGTLPTGISLDSTTGVLSGVVDPGVTDGNVSVTIQVSSTPSTVSKAFVIIVASSKPAFSIDASNIGTISKGCKYHGTLVAQVGSSAAVGPFTWEVSPISTNPLPTGLVLSIVGDSNPLNSGSVATITGNCIAILSNYPVVFRVIDAHGIATSATVLFNSAISVVIKSTKLDQAKVGTAYINLLNGTSCNTPLVWSLASGSPALPSGFTLTSGGNLSGTAATASVTNFIFQLTDGLGDMVTATLPFTIKNSDLVISTTSVTNISNSKAWSFPLVATGGAPGPYSWSIAPSSASQLPNNVQLSASTGLLSTTGSTDLGSKSITFRVTDSDGTITDKVLTVAVVPYQVVTPGPDYVNSTSHGYLGFIRQYYCGITNQIYPRTSKSFYAIFTNFDSTSLSQITVSTSDPNITAVPDYMNGTSEVGILITVGANGNLTAPLGDNTFSLTIVDNSSPFSTTMKYKVIAGKSLNLNQGGGAALPVKYINAQF